MVIKEMRAKVTRLVNIGNYENVSFTCEVSVAVDPNEPPEKAYDSAIHFCKEQINYEVTALDCRMNDEPQPVKKYTNKENDIPL